jgi:hypothetical protein
MGFTNKQSKVSRNGADRHLDCILKGTIELYHSFCEEDYAVTLYIAEFINTLTNITHSTFPASSYQTIDALICPRHSFPAHRPTN